MNQISTIKNYDSSEGDVNIIEKIYSSVSLKALIHDGELDQETVYAVGHNLYSQERYEDALRIFGLLVMSESLDRKYICAFAACLKMMGRYESAIHHYGVATLLDPDDPVVMVHTCECLIYLGRMSQAQEGLGIAIELCKEFGKESLKRKAEALYLIVRRSIFSSK